MHTSNFSIQPRIHKLRADKLKTTIGLLGFLLLPLFLGLSLSWHSLGELDVWLHDTVGQQILAGGGFPRTNTFSFTEPDSAWTNHEWLFQVLVAGVGQSSGSDPAQSVQRWNFLRLILIMIMLGVLLLGERPWRARWPRILVFSPAMMLGVFLLWPRFLVRPELISYIFIVLLIRLIENGPSLRETTPPWKSSPFLATILTIVWAQFHGFSSLAPVLWLLGCFMAFIPGNAYQSGNLRYWGLGLVALILAQILTPNGWTGLVYPLKALSQFHADGPDMRRTIAELVPLRQSSGSLHLTILAFYASIVWGLAALVWTRGRGPYLRILIWLLAAGATLAAQRNIGIYALSFLLLNLGLVGSPQLSSPRFSQRPTPLAHLAWSGPALALGLALWLFPQITNDEFYLREGVSRRFGSGMTEARFPQAGTEALGPSSPMRAFANVDAAAWTLNQSGAKLFIDGRTEAYSATTWSQYALIKSGGDEALAILERHKVQAVLLATAGGGLEKLVHALIQSPRWSIQALDEAGILWLRADSRDRSADTERLASGVRHAFGLTTAEKSPTRRADRLAALANLANLSGADALGDRILRAGLQESPNHPPLHHNLGNKLLAQGRYAKALNHFQKALEINPRLEQSALNAGVCSLKLDDAEGAIPHFQRAVSLNPNHGPYRVNLGLAWLQKGNKDKALNEFRQALALNPQNRRLRSMIQDLTTKDE